MDQDTTISRSLLSMSPDEWRYEEYILEAKILEDKLASLPPEQVEPEWQCQNLWRRIMELEAKEWRIKAALLADKMKH